jgi:hypothetical protein
MTEQQEEMSPFSHLVIMLASSALQQLGKAPGPDGQPGPVHLEGAQAMIDMIEMLETKTSGNLSDDEARILKDALTMLRFQFVDAKNESSSPAKESTQSIDPGLAKDASSASEEKEEKTRFRKSYG